MSLGTGGLHYKFADFIGLVSWDSTAKTKLAFLYCIEIVKNSILRLPTLPSPSFLLSLATLGYIKHQ